MIRRVLPLVAAVSFAALAGCSADSNEAGSSNEAATSSGLAASDYQLSKGTLAWGENATDSLSTGGKKAWAIAFTGKTGDAVKGTVGSTCAGKASILKKVSASSFVTVTEVGKAKNKDAETSVTLETDGTFLIAFEPTIGTGPSTDLCTFGVTLDGTPVSGADAWLKDMKQEYVNNDPSSGGEFKSIAESKLPGTAPKKEFDHYTKLYGDDYPPTASSWSFKGRTVYVVEDDNDGGMYIAFYDETGKLLASGSAGESSDFSWD